jgi:1-acyl-sn-glycerol-3-phosphate acyltransferase
VYPGGSREIFETNPDSTNTTAVLRGRKGFVRLAAASGADLVPVFVFGEKRCYRRLNVHATLRDWLLRRLKIPLILFWGRFGTWYPFKAKQTVVFGAPIATAEIDDDRSFATDDERFAARVDRLHAEYCDAVTALFETHKAEAGYGPEETLTVA